MSLMYGCTRLRDACDWKPIVGAKNWRPGKSAFELAHSWQCSDDFPPAVRRMLNSACPDKFEGLAINLRMVEWPVRLDSDDGPSMNDLMIWGENANDQRIVIAVEGKAAEYFGPTIKEWIKKPKNPTNRINRLDCLNRELCTGFCRDDEIRYQLLHRTASAILEARFVGAVAALVLIHSFAKSDRNWADYCTFLECALPKAQTPKRGEFQRCRDDFAQGLELYFAWVDEQPIGGR